MTTETFCCENCFEHPWLQAKARETQGIQGTCYYCGSESKLIGIENFHAGFANLLSDYIATDGANGGKDDSYPSVPPLGACQRDWNAFSSGFMSRKPERFFSAMFKERGFPGFLRSFEEAVVPFHRNAMSTAFGKWRDFFGANDAEFDIDHVNVADLDTPGTFLSQYTHHLSYFVRPYPAGETLWRARADYEGTSTWNCQPLPISQMGGNPAYPHGRLNRVGESVFYCAESEKTALSEVRPGAGYFCTTCKVNAVTDMFLLDLVSTLERLNPFTCAELSWRLDLQRVARNIGMKIAQPMSRGEDAVLYRKTQFIGSIVRAMKLNGLRFKSSLDPEGVNLALFDAKLVTLSEPRLVTITRTELAYQTSEPAFA